MKSHNSEAQYKKQAPCAWNRDLMVPRLKTKLEKTKLFFKNVRTLTI